MEYFRLMQDPAYHRPPIIPHLDIINQFNRWHLTPEKAQQIDEVTIFQISGQEQYDFVDILDRQIFLVSGPLKELIALYAPALIFKTVVLVHMAHMYVYYLPIFAPLECLSAQSLQTPDKSRIKTLVLKQDCLQGQTVFRVRHACETIIVARLDAAESILRRDFRGVKLQRVELDEVNMPKERNAK